MRFKDSKAEEDWDECYKINDDPYGRAAVDYAKAWAELMEEELSKGKILNDIAKETSHKADNDGITGFMYGWAVKILSQVWIHGEELRRWHNLDIQIGNEGEIANENGTTLNPAVLNIEYKE